jgi:hypothetical protein
MEKTTIKYKFISLDKIIAEKLKNKQFNKLLSKEAERLRKLVKQALFIMASQESL